MVSTSTDVADSSIKKGVTFSLIVLSFFMIIEYGRPALLNPFRPGLILQSILFLLLIRNFRKVLGILNDGYFRFYILLLIEMAFLTFIASNNYVAFHFFLGMLLYLVISISICMFVDSVERLKKLLTVLTLVLLAGAVAQLLADKRAGGFIGDENDFALAMNVIIPITLFMSISYSGLKKWGFRLATLVFTAANASVASRGGFVGLIAVSILIWLRTKMKIEILVVTLLAALVFVGLTPPEFKDELFSLDEASAVGTGKGRIELWKAAWRMFADQPLLGVGQCNLSYRLGEYQYDAAGNTFWLRDISGTAVHSIYFTVIAELGVVGVLIWLCMLYNLFRKYRAVMRAAVPEDAGISADTMFLRNIMIGLSTGLVGYLVSGIFLSAFYYPFFWHLSALITTVYMIKEKIKVN